METTNPIPDGYHTATPYLIVRDAADAITFYKEAFSAEELMRLTDSSGKIGHAEIRIGDSPIMLADEMPDMGYHGPQSLGGSPISIHLYVENVDTWFDRAVAAGAESRSPVKDEFYGVRSGKLMDPFGHVWMIATAKEVVAPEEVQRRFEALMEEQQGD